MIERPVPASITVKTPATMRTSVRRRRLVARVVHGPAEPLPPPHRLGEGTIELGRTVTGEGDLALADPSVSRVHARLSFERGIDAYVITDCGSSNGVFVNGGAIDAPRAVGVGDVIRLGDSILVLAEAVAFPDDDDDPMGLYGESAVMHALRRTIRQVGPSALPVLVVGATGTGKELVARALHAQSGRDGAFVAVNCAALAPTMVENALFGHRKGAFTGAIADAPGAFVAAHGGTLFLDEVGDMPVDAQPKLLRALENGEVTAVGAASATVVDVRVVAATHVPLTAAIAAHRFREDLYARLAGVTVATPRLAERREDIAGLWRRLLPDEVRARPATADVVEALLIHDWPRNVRELRRLAERIAVLHPDAAAWELADLDAELADLLARRRHGDPCDGPSPGTAAITPAEVVRRAAVVSPTADGAQAGGEGDAAADARDVEAEADDDDATARGDDDGDTGDGVRGPMPKDELLALLAACNGRVAEAARRARRNRKQIYRWMDAYGIPRGTGRNR